MLDFLTSEPTPEQIDSFRPTDEMQARLKVLVEKERDGALSAQEYQELSEYERIEHLIVMFKASALSQPPQSVS